MSNAGMNGRKITWIRLKKHLTQMSKMFSIGKYPINSTNKRFAYLRSTLDYAQMNRTGPLRREALRFLGFIISNLWKGGQRMNLELKTIEEHDELCTIIEYAMDLFVDKIQLHLGHPLAQKYEELYHTADSYLQRLYELKKWYTSSSQLNPSHRAGRGLVRWLVQFQEFSIR